MSILIASYGFYIKITGIARAGIAVSSSPQGGGTDHCWSLPISVGCMARQFHCPLAVADFR